MPGEGSGRYSDAEIIQRSLIEPHRFESVFDRHYGTIYRYIARRLDSPGADDLASEVFLRAFDHRDRFVAATHGSCLPWLYGIATNVMRRESRRRYRESKAVRRIGHPSDIPDTAEEVAWSVDARCRVEESGIIDAINNLRDCERETFYLYAIGEASYAEIADTMGVPIGTVRSRLSRVREKLRAQIEATVSPEEEP